MIWSPRRKLCSSSPANRIQIFHGSAGTPFVSCKYKFLEPPKESNHERGLVKSTFSAKTLGNTSARLESGNVTRCTHAPWTSSRWDENRRVILRSLQPLALPFIGIVNVCIGPPPCKSHQKLDERPLHHGIRENSHGERRTGGGGVRQGRPGLHQSAQWLLRHKIDHERYFNHANVLENVPLAADKILMSRSRMTITPGKRKRGTGIRK